MKILLVHNYYRLRGGEDVVFEAEHDLLRAHGHDVEIYTVKSEKGMGTVEKLKTAVAGFYNHAAAHSFKQVLQKFKPDVIHVHNFFPLLSPAIFDVAYQLNIPVVMTLHNFRLICPNATFLRDSKICTDCLDTNIAWAGIRHKCYQDSALATAINTGIMYSAQLNKIWQEKITRYIVLNPQVKDLFVQSKLNISSSKFIIKPNSTPDYGFSASKEQYALFVGRLCEEKGLRHLIESFKQMPEIELKIAGTGPLEDFVRQASQDYSNINYLGSQPRENIMALLKSAAVLIFSSIWIENCPMTILEAFSTGTPVIAPDIPSMQYFVRHQENGLLYSIGQADKLRETVKLFFSNACNHKMFSDTARHDWETRFSPEVGYSGLISVYEQALSENKAFNV